MGSYGTRYTLTAHDVKFVIDGTYRKGDWLTNRLSHEGNIARANGDEMGVDRVKAMSVHASKILRERRGK